MLVVRHFAICEAGENHENQTDHKWKYYPLYIILGV
jgi:hypothetical protein